MVCSVGIRSTWDLAVFSRQLPSWHRKGSSLWRRPQVFCREWRDVWMLWCLVYVWFSFPHRKCVVLSAPFLLSSWYRIYARCSSGQDAFKRFAWTLASLSMREPRKQSRLVPVFLLPHRETSASEHLFQAGLFLHHQLYRGRGRDDVACWEVIAVAPFDWALHYVELRTLLFTERHPRKLQSMVEKNFGF